MRQQKRRSLVSDLSAMMLGLLTAPFGTSMESVEIMTVRFYGRGGIRQPPMK